MIRTKLILFGVLALVLIAGGVGLATLLASSPAGAPASVPPKQETTRISQELTSAALREAVTPGGILEHERRFAAIAEENGGNRAAGTPGYRASAEYVARTLREAGYEVKTQRFGLPDEGEGDATTNVIATSPEGDEEHTVMLGAHLDSVPAGPGINDNGSGSATVLEIAEEIAQLDEPPRNRVRFAFWGGEELGLLGSNHYVERLSAGETEDIAVYLNFDMVASPNYVRFLYGSPEVTLVFENYFESQGLGTETFDLAGRSDHGPFAAEDIPVGGIFSGDSTIKTERQEEDHGGAAGEPYDGCYHRSCDDLDNINRRGLDESSDAAAHATATFAQREYHSATRNN